MSNAPSNTPTGFNYKPGHTLYIRNFGTDMRARTLGQAFEKWGRIVRCDIPISSNPQAHRYAFVEFEEREKAELAHEKMRNAKIGNDIIFVEWAKSRERYHRDDKRRLSNYA
ncbi:Srp1 family splicing factor [Schizosaccharomyces pombe]|uniref:Putative splicing factor C222.18 n=1 Tax=Schizosaccharomyces pombe (strain 972 / ATCC 24843) TaxID=284812 RepID=YFMR_SCHPO|nr:putative Srp1 family splicing factor [Schizosaccharomyces pombe]C6Y4C0.1 RecName: Full=Putative splicing factor C222.18 [Schizosaccharomyces pombe 972h-]CBA11493.1 Srp1 family splicing factor (predicted) [Schizosaccharomyces pombe]|eukprot:NP_001343068.1 putative Srp1 family splicing factor [Schizosaccharomyces pombe]